MNIFTTSLLAATTLATVAFSTIAQDAATPVAINVHCPGVDFGGSHSTSKKAGIALADSYNSVHSITDNDDSELTVLSYHGKSYADQLLEHKSHAVAGEWSGLWNCHLCPDDDNFAARKAWENEFVARLLKSPAFQNVETCNIDMSVTSQDIANAPNVDITVKCNSTSFKNLSVSKGTFLAHAVQAAYNKVHEDDAQDDSHLDNVVYHASPDKKHNEKQLLNDWWNRWYHHHTMASPSMTGDWDCSVCPDDDDNTEFVGIVGSALKAWEAELVVTLTEGPIAAFHDISSCDIDLRPYSVVEYDTGCGLRVCSE